MISNSKMLIPEFMGGLGNMMFQLASTYSIAKQTGHDFSIIDIPMPPEKHSNINYKNNIFSKWVKYKTNKLSQIQIREIESKLIDLTSIKNISNEIVVSLNGYFQYESYLNPYKSEVLNLFDLSIRSEILDKYNDINDAYFLHIRRGDYVGNSFHELDLMGYYKRAIQHIGKGVAYIVSNDIEWCKQWDFLKSIPHRFVEENDVDTLIIMSQCGLGGITANSTFSWWGLYLNTERPNLIMPSKWYPHDMLNGDGYYFKEATILSV